MRSHLRACVVVVVGGGALCTTGCAAGSRTTVRELPPDMKPLSALLEGCEHSAGEDGSALARCDDDVVFKVRQVEADSGSAPRYFGDGVDLANNNAGRMSWEQVRLSTAFGRGHADRGAVHAVTDDHVVVVLLGVTRARSPGQPRKLTEASCQAPPSSTTRCEQLISAFVDLPSEPTAAAAGAANPGRGAAGPSHGAVHGRAISFPTSCGLVAQDATSGRYACDDDARLFWLVTDDMDNAAEQAEVAVGSLVDGDERQDAPCSLLDADARCQETPTAIIGLGYVDKAAVVVVCLAPGGQPWEHSLCKSSFRRR